MMMNTRLPNLLLAAGSALALAGPIVAPAQAAPRKPAAKAVRVAALVHRPVLPHPAVRTAPLPGAAEGAYGAAATISRPAGDLMIAIGRGQLVTLPSTMKDVFVADDKVADVQVKSNNQLYVFGRGPGETTIYASNAAGQVIWSANLRVASNIDSVDQMLRVAMPDARIAVSTMGASTLLLTGTVHAPEDAAEAERLVQAYVGKGANIITRLKTATPLQVNLQVRFAEVSRTLTKSLSSRLNTIDSTSGMKFGVGQGGNVTTGTGSLSSIGVGVTPYTYGVDPTSTTGAITKITGTTISNSSTATTLAAAGKLFGMNILAALDAAENIGLATTLAQPNLTALSGETGEFLAGGEFPIPISSTLGTVSIEFKRYGVSLSYTPTVLADGRISLRVRPEVSELTSDGAVTLNGYTIPALTTRRAETSVELGSGQSIMIGGLLRNTSSNSVQKLPGAGDVPILGTLFRSTAYKRGETELVIVVTPYLVKPVNDGDIKLPTDGMESINDIERVIGNKVTDGKTGGKRPGATAAPTGSAATAADAPRAAGTAKSDGKPAAQSSTPGFSLN